MATILNDKDIAKLLGTIIIGGDPSSIRPNSYIVRLGAEGEFINAGKEFTLGKNKKGIKVSPGHSVALTAMEEIDFRPATVQKLFPNCGLHAFISPTTDLSREGIIAPTTQVDAGYHGTLNWTITNCSNEERRFLYGERLYRITFLKLEAGEVPLKLYEGDYQGHTGYVRSRRAGPPVGMRDSEWEDSLAQGGPEVMLENLMKAGYPWHALGQKLKSIDQQFKIVSEEYGAIHDSLDKLNGEVKTLTSQHGDISRTLPQSITAAIKDEAASLQNRWLLTSASMIVGLLGLTLTITSNAKAFDFMKTNGAWVGLILLLIGIIVTIIAARRRPAVVPARIK